MKSLLLVRHAKSSWKDDSLADFDRPLNGRGKRDAPEMGRRLAARGILPSRIISSSAVRARITAEILASELRFDRQRIELAEELYGAGPDDILAVVKHLNPRDECVMLVGHNPTVTDLAGMFARDKIDNVPTCGILTIRTPAWTTIESDAELLDFDYPKKPQVA